MRRFRWLSVAVVAVGLVLTGCSGSTPGGSKTGGKSDRGPITFVRGKDTTGKIKPLLDKWNQAHPDEKVTLLELPEAADDQRAGLVQNAQARSSRFDVLGLDVVWTAEFAARKWVEPLDGKGIDTGRLLPSSLKTGTYQDKLYAVPWNTNAAFLYYRKDLVPTPPKTWDEMIKDCGVAKKNKMDCYAGQFAQYEGLTVNISEAVNSAGGDLVKNDGKEVAVPSPEAKRGLQFLVDGFKQGYIPKKAITYKEEESRRAFQQGKLLFLRNWPYVYGLASQPGADSIVQGKFGIAPIPGPDGVGASTLGGYNLAVSAFSAHKQTAADFIKYMIEDEGQRYVLTEMSLPPTVSAIYDDAELQQKVPYLGTLKQALLAARARPATPNYNEVTLAIQKSAYEALQGKKSIDDALSQMAEELKQAAGD